MPQVPPRAKPRGAARPAEGGGAGRAARAPAAHGHRGRAAARAQGRVARGAGDEPGPPSAEGRFGKLSEAELRSCELGLGEGALAALGRRRVGGCCGERRAGHRGSIVRAPEASTSRVELVPYLA